MAPVTSEKISLTASVTEECAGERLQRISFGMPPKIALETLPESLDRRIAFKVVKSRGTAAIYSQDAYTRNSGSEDRLKEWQSRNGLTPKSNFVVAFYSPPFIPGILSRNEMTADI
jgi:hypothetical protein